MKISFAANAPIVFVCDFYSFDPEDGECAVSVLDLIFRQDTRINWPGFRLALLAWRLQMLGVFLVIVHVGDAG